MLQAQVHRTEPVPGPGVWLRMGGLPGWWGHPGNSMSGLFLGGSGAVNTVPPPLLFLLRWTVTMAPSSAPMDDCACARPRPLPLKTLPHFPPPSQGRAPPPSCSPTCCSHRFFRFSPPSHDGTGPLPGAAASLCAAAAVVVLAAVAFSRKWISCGVRIHSPPGDPAHV